MPAMKRPAAAASSYVPAKRRAVHPVHKALGEAAGYPTELLRDMLPFSLGEFQSARDPRQQEIVDVVGEALASVLAAKESAVSALEARVEGFDAEKAARADAEATARAALESLGAAVVEAAAAVEADKEAVAQARTALREAKTEQQTGDAGARDAAARKADLDKALAEHLAPAKDAKAPPKSIKALTQVGKKFGFDSTLVACAHAALEKVPEKRGDFDQVLMKQFEDEFAKHGAAVAKELAEAEPGRRARAEVVAKAEEALEAATAAQKQHAEAHGKALAARKAGEQKLREAEQAVKTWLPDCKKVFDALEDAKRALADFKEGPLKCFEELKVQEPAPEEPEEPEMIVDDAVPEEPAAAAEPEVAVDPTPEAPPAKTLEAAP